MIQRKTSWTIFNTAFISRQKKCVLCAKKNMSDVIVNWQKQMTFWSNNKYSNNSNEYKS